MIQFDYYEEKGVYTVNYNGAITLEDYLELVQKAENILHNLPAGEKVSNITNLTHGKVVNKDVTKAMAEFTKRNSPYFKTIHIVGMSAFMKILYKTFLLLVGKNNPTVVENRSYSEVCAEYNIPQETKKAAS